MRLTTVDEHRAFWAEVAQQHGWYIEPFFVVTWVNDAGEITDSVSHIGLDRDYILSAVETD